MLCEGLMQARDEHMSQTNVEPVHYYHIGVPRHVGSTQKTHRSNHNKHTGTLKMWG